MNTTFSNILISRMNYFDAILFDFESYGPDTKNQLHGYLPKIKVLEPFLHEVVAQLYEKMLISCKENLSSKKEDYELYKTIKNELIAYIKSKKKNANQESLLHLDIWTKVFPLAFDSNKAQELLNASDQLEDLLWLAEVANKHKIPDENVHLSEQIEKLLKQLSTHFSLIIISSDNQKKIEKLLEEIRSHYLDRQYNQMKEEIVQLKSLISA